MLTLNKSKRLELFGKDQTYLNFLIPHMMSDKEIGGHCYGLLMGTPVFRVTNGLRYPVMTLSITEVYEDIQMHYDLTMNTNSSCWICLWHMDSNTNSELHKEALDDATKEPLYLALKLNKTES